MSPSVPPRRRALRAAKAAALGQAQDAGRKVSPARTAAPPADADGAVPAAPPKAGNPKRLKKFQDFLQRVKANRKVPGDKAAAAGTPAATSPPAASAVPPWRADGKAGATTKRVAHADTAQVIKVDRAAPVTLKARAPASPKDGSAKKAEGSGKRKGKGKGKSKRRGKSKGK